MSDDIFTAAETNNVKRLEQFLADGIDVNLRDYDRQNTPIHWAASGGNLDAIELLLEYGADVNAQNKNGRTPLHCLISERFDKIALWLIKCCGADPHIPDKRGVSAYDLAQKFFQPEIDEAVKNQVKITVKQQVDDGTSSESHEMQKIKVFTVKTNKFKEIEVEDDWVINDLVAALVSELGWPKKIERYIEISEHMEKQVGNKKLKKERVCVGDANVFDLQDAWPNQDDCYFFFNTTKDAPTQAHVLYGKV